MATNKQVSTKRSSAPSRSPSRAATPKPAQASDSTITLPIVHAKVTPEHLAYFVGLGVFSALDVIEWPMAVFLAVGQIVAQRAHRRIVREIVGGVRAAA